MRAGGRDLRQDAQVASGLEQILDGNGVSTVFQPIVDLQHGGVVGYEALSRFAVEPLGPPDQWFSLAAQHGVTAELDAVATATALARRPDAPADCFLTINVEPSSLLAPAWRRVVEAVGDLTAIVFELTEHRPSDLDGIDGAMAELRAAGAMFALDDTGAGYAGLDQLLRLRPQFLKIDRAIVSGVDHDEAKLALIEMLGTFGSRLDAWLISEGVERGAEAIALQRLGVPLAQGYAFGRPQPDFADVDLFSLLGDPTARRTYELADLIDPVEIVTMEALQAVALDDDERYVVVVDARGRPRGLIDVVTAPTMVIDLPMVASVHDAPTVLAARLSTRDALDLNRPIVVIDDGGEVAGLVTVRRLLGSLGEG